MIGRSFSTRSRKPDTTARTSGPQESTVTTGQPAWNCATGGRDVGEQGPIRLRVGKRCPVVVESKPVFGKDDCLAERLCGLPRRHVGGRQLT